MPSGLTLDFAGLDQHALHLVGDHVVKFLLVFKSVTTHLVHAIATLLHSQKMDQPRVLSGLSPDFVSLANVRLRRACDHVLVPTRVDDGAVPLLRLDGVVPLLRCNRMCVSCQTDGKDKACCRVKLRLQASVAARHRLVMGRTERPSIFQK